MRCGAAVALLGSSAIVRCGGAEDGTGLLTERPLEERLRAHGPLAPEAISGRGASSAEARKVRRGGAESSGRARRHRACCSVTCCSLRLRLLAIAAAVCHAWTSAIMRSAGSGAGPSRFWCSSAAKALCKCGLEQSLADASTSRRDCSCEDAPPCLKRQLLPRPSFLLFSHTPRLWSQLL